VKNILLIGAGGHAKSCIDVIEKQKKYKIIGLIDKNKSAKNLFKYPIIDENIDINILYRKCKNILIAVGQIKSPSIRIKLFKKYKKFGFNFPTIISPLAHVSKYSSISEGTIIMHHAMVNASCKIGISCIINSKALIEHDVEIGNFCHISTSTILNGNVKVGNKIFIGSNSTISNSIKIKDNVIIPAMSFINK
tara:strand:+ start:974 stop:1552 length:579 start_codon:yes stop_codon:yes gene_type:complete